MGLDSCQYLINVVLEQDAVGRKAVALNCCLAPSEMGCVCHQNEKDEIASMEIFFILNKN